MGKGVGVVAGRMVRGEETRGGYSCFLRKIRVESVSSRWRTSVYYKGPEQTVSQTDFPLQGDPD